MIIKDVEMLLNKALNEEEKLRNDLIKKEKIIYKKLKEFNKLYHMHYDVFNEIYHLIEYIVRNKVKISERLKEKYKNMRSKGVYKPTYLP